MQTPDKRERTIAVLKGEKPPVIPSLAETGMDVTVFRDLLPEPTGDPIRDAVARAEFFDNTSVGVGIGIGQQTVSRDATHHTYEYETGAVWHESYVPTFNREATRFPINLLEDVRGYTMVRPSVDPHRVDSLRKQVEAFHDLGYFVQGSTMGAWMGIYYYLTSFENILTWMAVEPEAAHQLFSMTSAYSLEAAEALLRCGVDDVFVASDLGTGSGLLFSPPMFDEYVAPWLRDLANLCHSHDAFLHLHSHGHIQDLMEGIVDSGVDLINPVGPSDRNDLALFKERWGDRICFMGGISTTIQTMTPKEVEAHVHEVVEIGRVGGRFFPRTESGVPPMSPEQARHYVETLTRERRRGYA